MGLLERKTSWVCYSPHESCGILLKAIFIMDERMFLRETMSLPKIARFTSVHRDSFFQDVVECAKVHFKLLAWQEDILPGLLQVIPRSRKARISYLLF